MTGRNNGHPGHDLRLASSDGWTAEAMEAQVNTRQLLTNPHRAPGVRSLSRSLVAACVLLLLATSASAARRDDGSLGESAPELSPLPTVRLDVLDFAQRDGATVIGITASAPLLHHTVYEAGDHIIIELPGADVSRLAPIAEIGTAQVDSVLVEAVPDAGKGLARLTIRRAPGSTRRVGLDPSNPRRLEIVVTSGAPAAPAAVRPSASAVLSSPPAAAQPAPRPAPVAAPSRGLEPVREMAASPASPTFAPSVMSPAPSPAPAAMDAGPARPSRLVDARVETAADGRAVLRLTSTGRLTGQAFLIDSPPPRLVVDLPGTVNEITSGVLSVRHDSVLKIRIAQNKPLPDAVTRVVFELRNQDVPHEIIEGPNSLIVALGRPVAGAPALAAFGTGGAPASGQDLLTLPAGDPFAHLGRPANASGVAPQSLRETADASIASQAIQTLKGGSGEGSRYDAVQVTEGAQQYTGDAIDISMKDAELQDVFRLFHQFTGLNIIVDSSVRGKTITLELVQVPWDQALALVLQTNGLGSQLDGNVLRIAPLQKLAAEEQQKKAFQEAQELSGTLDSVAIPLSYASGTQVEQIVKKSLSSRGDIQIDRRTNTVIVKDLKSRLDEVKRLIALLDTPTRQVVIEARIVETTVDFSKATGVRWGFNYIADRAFGNQTGFSFPRSILTDYAVNLPAQSASSILGLSFRNILNTFALDLSLQALESRGKARVISRPMVMVQNNQRAEISSGFQIPITNTTATETDVTFVPATLSLSVTPQITADDNVIMDIEVHNDTPGFLVGDNPSIATRNARTVVAVPDGGTTVIGGIYTVNEGTSSGRVPFLSRIPLLGWLFRNKQVDRTNDELLIFLTPRIQK